MATCFSRHTFDHCWRDSCLRHQLLWLKRDRELSPLANTSVRLLHLLLHTVVHHSDVQQYRVCARVSNPIPTEEYSERYQCFREYYNSGSGKSTIHSILGCVIYAELHNMIFWILTNLPNSLLETSSLSLYQSLIRVCLVASLFVVCLEEPSRQFMGFGYHHQKRNIESE